MAFTSHGYHIPGTVRGEPPTNRQRCGGLILCKRCKSEVESAMATKKFATMSNQEKAVNAVRKVVDDRLDMDRISGDVIPEYNLHVVFFTYILRNWKAVVSVVELGLYYEVTYDSARRKCLVNEHVKNRSIEIPD